MVSWEKFLESLEKGHSYLLRHIDPFLKLELYFAVFDGENFELFDSATLVSI
jgi:hypothetical protein